MLSSPIAQDAPAAMAQEAAEAAVEDSALDEAVVAEVATAGIEARIHEIREAGAEREGNITSFL